MYRKLLLLLLTLFSCSTVKKSGDNHIMPGGNCIRNTMSDRDPGDMRAFFMTTEGKYDLNKWDGEYWQRFENLLKLTNQRETMGPGGCFAVLTRAE